MPFHQVEILDVAKSAENTLEPIAGFNIEKPEPGGLSSDFTFEIAGWIVGKKHRVEKIEIVLGERVLRQVVVNIARPDVAAVFPEIKGAPESGFQVRVGAHQAALGELTAFTIQACLQDQSRVALGIIRVRKVSQPDVATGPEEHPADESAVDEQGFYHHVEILDISKPAGFPASLGGFNLEEPRPGTRTNDFALTISGWVFGKSSPAAEVAILRDGKLLQTVAVNIKRDDIVAAFPTAAGAQKSGFRGMVGLIGTDEMELEIQVILQDQTCTTIAYLLAKKLKSAFQEHLPSEATFENIEIIGTAIPPLPAEALWAGDVTIVEAGTSLQGVNMLFSGWVLGRRSPAEAVEIIINEEYPTRIPFNDLRPDVCQLYPDVPGAEESGFRAIVNTLGLDEIVCQVFAILKDKSRILIRTILARRIPKRPDLFIKDLPASTAAPVLWGPALKDSLKTLISSALNTHYISISCKDGIQTGNHYQSIRLGETQTHGFRSDRHQLLDQIDFRDKSVLDLGSNLGELSRMARERGADFVDGFEYDQLFIDLANLINAFNGVSRVSFYRQDITNPAIYERHYDIVMAFSVFTYIEGVLPELAAITDELLVLETHRVDNTLESAYLKPISRHFPYYRILGKSEWGTSLSPEDTRIVIAFAKREEFLHQALKNGASEEGVVHMSPAGGPADGEPVVRYIDTRRTDFGIWSGALFRFDSINELFTILPAMEIDLKTLANSAGQPADLYRSWIYWWVYVKGYLQYLRSGTIDADNICVNYLMENYILPGEDPLLSRQVRDPSQAAARLEGRYRDFKTIQDTPKSSLPSIKPVWVMARGSRSTSHPLVIYEAGADFPIHAASLDGWHRLFAARVCGIEKVPFTL